MSHHTDFLRKPAVELQNMLHQGELSPVELTELTLELIEEVDGDINAVCTLNENAVAEAKALEERVSDPREKPLYGLPVGIKDVTETEGIRTTYGCPLYEDHVPDQDALVVERFREAGAVIIGKTNTPEFAAGGNTFNEVFGRTRNPWDLEKSAGGSTGGGAAALASGTIAIAQGTDLGGSLRIPASFCGITGLRPTPGLVPTHPSNYLWDNMQVTGTMGRTAEDIALSLDAVAGRSEKVPVGEYTEHRSFLDSVQEGLEESLSLAYCSDIAGIGIDEEVRSICREATDELEQSDTTLDRIDFDLSYGWDPFLAVRGFWMLAHHHDYIDKVDEFGDNLAGNIKSGLETPMKELGAAAQARSKIWEEFRSFFQQKDFLLTPTMAVPPFPVTENYPETIGGKEMDTYIDWVAPTFILSLTGLPVASVPVGRTEEGTPVGLQIVGPPRSEERVLAFASRVEDLRDIGLPELNVTHE